MFRKVDLEKMDNVVVLFAQEKAKDSLSFIERVEKVQNFLRKSGITFEVSFRQEINKSQVYSVISYTHDKPKQIRKAIFVQQIEDKLPGWENLSIEDLSEFIYKNPGYLNTILIIDNATNKVYTDNDFATNFEL